MSEFQYGPRQYLSRRLRGVASSSASGEVASRPVTSTEPLESVASVQCHASVVRSASARSRELVASVASVSVRSVLRSVPVRLRQAASVSRHVASDSVQSVLRRCLRFSSRVCRSVASREASPSSPRSMLAPTLAKSRRAAAQSRSERIGQRLAGLPEISSAVRVASARSASVSRSGSLRSGRVAGSTPQASAASPGYLQ